MDQLIAVLRRIEIDYGADGFHGDGFYPPALYVLTKMEDGGERLRHHRQRLPDWIWSTVDTPGRLLAGIERTVRSADHRMLASIGALIPVQRIFAGFAMATEGWALGEVDGVDREELEQVANNRMIGLHPLRREVRYVAGVDINLRVAQVGRDAVTDLCQAETEESHPDIRHRGIAVPQGLIRLVSTMSEMIEAGLYG